MLLKETKTETQWWPGIIAGLVVKYNKSQEITDDELIKKYDKIINSFQNIKTSKFIDIYFGNNAINSNELLNILPIYNYDI